MRIAYVHDWLVVNGGAEKVARAILELYPEAEVFSLIDFLSPEDRADILHGKFASTSPLQRIPGIQKHYRKLLPLFPWAIEQLNLRDFDLIISSSYAVAKGVKTRPDQLHICYCHTPMRYAWDLREAYLQEAGWQRGMKGWLANWILNRLQRWDRKTANRVTHFIANSAHVANRIKRFYGRESVVIYPPVETELFQPSQATGDYYVTASRLVPYKKTRPIVEAFRDLPKLALVALGEGPERPSLRQEAPANVQLPGHLAREQVVEHMQRAKALILAAEEDFGITSLEAQSCGTPVIALRKGGYLETVVDGRTGLFFEQATPEAIREAILTFEREGVQGEQAEIAAHARQFDRTIFLQKFKDFVAEKWDAFNRK